MTLPVSIKLAASTVKLFSNMHSSKEDLYFGRKSFYQSDGMPWLKTIDCLISTVDSWKALVSRLEYFNQNLVSVVDPSTITNESVIEHSFGSVKTRGQGYLQNFQEYTQAKRLKGVDFHLQMYVSLRKK